MIRHPSSQSGSVTRRGFLTRTAALAGAAAVGASPRANSAETRISTIDISLMMWTYRPRSGSLAERVASAEKTGIKALELTGTLRARDNREVAGRIRELGMRTQNVDAGTNMYGPKAALTNPAERSAVLENLREQIRTARLFGTDTLLALSGRDFADIPRLEQRASLVAGLEAMMEIVEGEGLRMIIEPLNRFDHKGYFLTSMYEGCDVVREVGSDKLKILFDIYHTQMEEGRLIKQIQDNIEVIGHFHVADCPGRHQPGTGELNYANIYRAIMKTGFTGSIGMEFLPQGDPDELLATNRKMLFEALAAA